MRKSSLSSFPSKKEERQNIDSSPYPSRRTLLSAAGITAISSLLDACLVRVAPFSASCAVNPQAGATTSPSLTIDTHCHLFNATDIQAAEFLIKIEGEKTVTAELLQKVAWYLAPDGREELKVLKRLATAKTKTISRAELKQKSYEKARNSILGIPGLSESAATVAVPAPLSSAAAQPTSASPQPPSQIPTPQTIEEVKRRIKARVHETEYAKYYNKVVSGGPLMKAVPTSGALVPDNCPAGGAGRTVEGQVDYVVQNFQYRYVMIQDYLDTFMENTGRCVHLIVASMVDYDWWLNPGTNTKTLLKTQVEVMEQISILSRGRVHGLVPFCPLREVTYRMGNRSGHNFSSLELVQKAVSSRGCIGVKLYPPMGFAPWNNKTLDGSSFWTGHVPSWLDGSIRYKDGTTFPGLGHALDDALKDLYDWCLAKDVPLMAHTSISNGVSCDFEKLAGAAHWRDALEQFKGLRISFGHLGDFSDSLNADKPPEAIAFLDLMTDGADTPGALAFGDTGYYSEILDKENAALTARFEAFYRREAAQGKARLADRLMYGTDWNLLISQGNIKSYFGDFAKLFATIDALPEAAGKRHASERFFGYNAVDWLGLRSGGARKRLDTFYKAHGIDTSDPQHWATMLDKASPT